jgi:hypothetical protein
MRNILAKDIVVLIKVFEDDAFALLFAAVTDALDVLVETANEHVRDI